MAETTDKTQGKTAQLSFILGQSFPVCFDIEYARLSENKTVPDRNI